MGNEKKRIQELEILLKDALEENKNLRAEIDALKEENTILKESVARLQKNSGNSSKPPSSDIVKPPKKQKSKGKRKIGAQKGHEQHLRTPFDETQVDKTIVLTLDACPDCGENLQTSNKPIIIHQQVELVDKPYIVTEYQSPWYWCDHCKRFHAAKLPPDVKEAGLFGPNLIALVAYLKGRGHMSYTTIQAFFFDVLSIAVSTGFLAKQVFKASEALARPYQELLDQLPQEAHLHVDETGGKENGEQRWIWCFRGKDITVFHVDPSRGSGVLEQLLGNGYAGIISCDFWGAYRKFSRLALVVLQFCWAHLIREVKYLAGSADKRVSRYGTRLLIEIQLMFTTIHRQDQLLERNWRRRMVRHREAILWEARHCIPKNKDAINIAERLKKWHPDYFRFIEAGIPATNNLGEQSIRRMVLDRKVTQGTRSDWGNRWIERIWSVLSTCEQRGVNVMSFLKLCIVSSLHGFAPPSLLGN